MTAAELRRALAHYPNNVEVLVNYDRIEKIEWCEGPNSDDSGTIVVIGEEYEPTPPTLVESESPQPVDSHQS